MEFFIERKMSKMSEFKEKIKTYKSEIEKDIDTSEKLKKELLEKLDVINYVKL